MTATMSANGSDRICASVMHVAGHPKRHAIPRLAQEPAAQPAAPVTAMSSMPQTCEAASTGRRPKTIS
ncbi:hypothetical protein [Marivita hallyeonensis]|uniref:hypothetical protein n=1 Tax=Marivita hallyeonensis TaxID=996342 RepID=UPI0011604730|nr:hypothetical protein [Marivita hallyeonensis]